MLRTETDNRVGFFASPFSEALPLRVVGSAAKNVGRKQRLFILEPGGELEIPGAASARITEDHAHRRAEGHLAPPVRFKDQSIAAARVRSHRPIASSGRSPVTSAEAFRLRC